MIDVKYLVRTAGTFVTKNAPAILTGIGVATSLASSVLAYKAGMLSKAVLDAAPEESKATFFHKAALTWKLWTPSLALAAISATCVIGANAVHAKRLAAIIRAANDELLRRAQAALSPEMETATQDYIEKLRTLADTFHKMLKRIEDSHGKTVTTEVELVSYVKERSSGITLRDGSSLAAWKRPAVVPSRMAPGTSSRSSSLKNTMRVPDSPRRTWAPMLCAC